MAWFDILGGAAGGLQQGLTQLQQAQRQRKEDQEEALRNFLSAVQSGLIDPLDVPGDAMKELGPQQMKALFTKDPSGKFMLRMEPGRMGELTRQRSAKNVIYGNTFSTLPVEQQVRIATESGLDPKDYLSRMSDKGRVAYQQIMQPPTIENYSDLMRNVLAAGQNLINARENLDDYNDKDGTKRNQIDARLENLGKQYNQLQQKISERMGLSEVNTEVDNENPFSKINTPEQPESSWLGTAGQLALLGASAYGGGKAVQLGGRYLLPRIAPGLATRLGIGTTKLAAESSPTVPVPARTSSMFGTSPRSVNMSPDRVVTPSSTPFPQLNMMPRPKGPPAPAASLEVFGPKGPPTPPAVTEQGQQHILDTIRSIGKMTDPKKAAAALEELQPLLQYFFGVSGKNPFRP